MTSQSSWYFARGKNPQGPMPLGKLIEKIESEKGLHTLVYGPGAASWIEARHVPAIVEQLRGDSDPPPPPADQIADEIDYEIFGEEMQYVCITLDPEEMVIAEAGAMMYMTAGIEMETVIGDPAVAHTGMLGKMMTAGKRWLTGESLFMTTFYNSSSNRQQVAFAAPYPGKIVPMDLAQLGGELICQKDSFVCAARGVEIGVAFQKRVGVGLFGGEGFIMQRLTGDGLTMVHAGGTLMHRRLEHDEVIKVDTGCLVALEPTVDFDVRYVGGIKNTLFGGEGLFFSTLTGPGDVWLQSLPFSRLAGRIVSNAPQSGGSKGEGSILGGFGNMISGDNH